MADVLTPKQRSRNMAAIRGKNTKPEMFVRSMTHRMGFRYVLHHRSLPGKPDLVFPARKKIIFVHGCFWHVHTCRFGKVIPKTNRQFWKVKRKGNVARDRRNIQALKRMGWKVFVIWECKTHDSETLGIRIFRFLKD